MCFPSGRDLGKAQYNGMYQSSPGLLPLTSGGWRSFVEFLGGAPPRLRFPPLLSSPVCLPTKAFTLQSLKLYSSLAAPGHFIPSGARCFLAASLKPKTQYKHPSSRLCMAWVAGLLWRRLYCNGQLPFTALPSYVSTPPVWSGGSIYACTSPPSFSIPALKEVPGGSLRQSS
jgi:hypothetical protein